MNAVILVLAQEKYDWERKSAEERQGVLGRLCAQLRYWHWLFIKSQLFMVLYPERNAI